MKKIYHLVLLLSIVVLCSCTQYNGHIGPIFGSWALVSITEDGDPLELGDETVISFQNEVVRVVRLVDPPYQVTNRYGNFTLSDNVLTLRFQTEPTASGSPAYMTPDWLYFPVDVALLRFDVRKLTGAEMVCSIDDGNHTMVYSFRKTW